MRSTTYFPAATANPEGAGVIAVARLLVAPFLAIALVFGAAACGGTPTSDDPADDNGSGGVADRADDATDALDRNGRADAGSGGVGRRVRNGNSLIRDDEVNGEPQRRSGPPAWVLSPMSNDDDYFYGIGTGTWRNPAFIGKAMSDAQTRARTSIAETIRVRVRGTVETYQRQVLNADGSLEEVGLSQSATESVVGLIVTGAHLVAMSFDPTGGNNAGISWALVRISIDDVARSMEESETLTDADYDAIRNSLLTELNLFLGPIVPPAEKPNPLVDNGEGNDENSDGTGSDESGDPPAVATPAADAVSADQVRQWVENRSDPRFPRAKYLIGVGIAQNASTAEASARQQLVAFFESRIQSVTTEAARSVTQVSQGGLEISERIESVSTTTQTVAGTIQGARVVGQGTHEGNTVVLVVLEIRPFLDNLRVKIASTEEQIAARQTGVLEYNERSQYLTALRMADAMIKLVAELLTYVEQYNLLAADPKAPAYTFADVENLLRELGQSLTVVFKLETVVIAENGSRTVVSSDALPGRVSSDLAARTPPTGITVRSGDAAFRRASYQDIRDMDLADIQKIAGDASFVVTGTITTRFDRRVMNNAAQFTTVYDLKLIELSSGVEFALSNPTGRGTQITNQTPNRAADDSRLQAIRRIADDMIGRLQGR